MEGREALPCLRIWVAEVVVQDLVVRQPEDRGEEPPVVTVEAEDQVVMADGLVEALGVIDDLTRGARLLPVCGYGWQRWRFRIWWSASRRIGRKSPRW